MSRAPFAAVVAALFVVAAAACEPVAPTPTPSAPVGPPPTSPIVGIVTSVDSAGLNQVRAFTLRDREGRQFSFIVGALENGAEFPPGHLAEHQITAEPVEVWFRVEAGQLVAYRLADAGGASPAPGS